ncbi:hypothetical protein; putative signal peptide [Bradyrhizobium sp. ORS 278]|uniref:hypothetical protein n=1 Tax=Bradyrhizobium sp. (strain ORS 278) TaxID=114615 RepID=UPI0001507CBD|nr:hypothetical protein [Bradyrhizobium sp. ORS 278]CAL76061.1 hypothetical protein; putative signal peptide [Bradyrhizobium sp. ORS 278]
MIMLFCLLFGAALGMRYNVFCLIPTILACGAGRLVLDLFQSAPTGSTAWHFVVIAASLQIGYLIGSVLQTVLAGGFGAFNGRACSPSRHARSS